MRTATTKRERKKNNNENSTYEQIEHTHIRHSHTRVQKIGKRGRAQVKTMGKYEATITRKNSALVSLPTQICMLILLDVGCVFWRHIFISY